MAVVSDKQFYVVLGLSVGAVALGGYVAYKTVTTVTKKVSGAVDYVKNDAADDAIDVAGDATKFVLGEPTANYLSSVADAFGSFWEWSGLGSVGDKFDLNYRDQLPHLSDEEYQRWKTAVQAGEIDNPFKPKI